MRIFGVTVPAIIVLVVIGYLAYHFIHKSRGVVTGSPAKPQPVGAVGG